LDIGAIAKLLTNPSDLPSAAKSLGMEHALIKPAGHAGPGETLRMMAAFERMAEAAQQTGSEVIELSGSPMLLKGKRVRILAVLE
jgi:hypothetical protein